MGTNGTFTDKEKEVIRQHPKYGKIIVENYYDKTLDRELYNYASEIVSFCHEKIDGSGFPFGLDETKIRADALRYDPANNVESERL